MYTFLKKWFTELYPMILVSYQSYWIMFGKVIRYKLGCLIIMMHCFHVFLKTRCQLQKKLTQFEGKVL